ncbi:MAG: acyltransferase [Syntrophales bacterium LBB04]|nr:acyltransferase [Syntrophales bacterium LBB04]
MPSNSFLRFIAIILIANSHLDGLYPVPALGTGGAIGNALFFMLSGYGLFLSEKNQNRNFLPWYKRRILRIYPTLILATALLFVIGRGAWRYLDFFGYIKLFVWPTDYWFIAALMIFYVIFFLMAKMKNYNYFLAGIFILFIPYVYFYLTMVDLSHYTIEGPGYFKWIFYLQTMFFGAYMAGRARFAKTGFIKHGLALILFIGLYYGILILMSRCGGWQFQAVTHFLMFPILFLFLKVSESDVVTSLMNTKFLGAAISLMALLTLEIYLVHGYVRCFSFILNILFPINIIVFWLITILFAYLLNRVAGKKEVIKI